MVQAPAIHGVLDGIAADAQGLQGVSDEQAAMMSTLASTLDGLSATLQGSAGVAMQNVGAQLHQQGLMFSSTFADHSAKMSNNGNILNTGDEDNAHLITQVGNLIV
jgi:uncharacterized protein YukE